MIYKILLRFNSSFLSPLQADTIFGHLCWAVYYKEGEDELKKFLQPFRENDPPFLLSDGFPVISKNDIEIELLPKPLTADRILRDDTKRIKKIEWVKIDDFNKIRKYEQFQLEEIENPFKPFLSVHNSISRITSSSLPEAGVYSLKEYFVHKIFILIKALNENVIDRVAELFKFLSNSGYGGKKSAGKGQFAIESIASFNILSEIHQANGFVTLSNFCPSQGDPTEGIYKIFVKYGKLGGELTFSGNPFKKPLLMIKTGSVFKINGAIREFYGRMVENICDIKPQVLQYAYAFPIPVVFQEERNEISKRL